MKKYTVTSPFVILSTLVIKDDILYAEDKKGLENQYVDIYSPKTRKKLGYMKKEEFVKNVNENLT